MADAAAKARDVPTQQVIPYFPDIDFGSRVSALRAVGTSIGASSIPDQSMANSQRSYLKWINLYRAKVSLPLYVSLDYHDFNRALNDILLAGGGGPEVTYPPIVVTAPFVGGSLAHPSVLTSTVGTWENTPSSYTYQWMRGAAAIAGATASTYTTAVADVGAMISCVVTAHNTAGTAASQSNQVGPIT